MSENSHPTKKSFLITALIATLIAIGAIAYAQTGQSHPWSEIDFTGVGSCSNICSDSTDDNDDIAIQDDDSTIDSSVYTIDFGDHLSVVSDGSSEVDVDMDATLKCINVPAGVANICWDSKSCLQCLSCDYMTDGTYIAVGGGCSVSPDWGGDGSGSGAQENPIEYKSYPSGNKQWCCGVELQKSHDIRIFTTVRCCKID